MNPAGRSCSVRQYTSRFLASGCLLLEARIERAGSMLDPAGQNVGARQVSDRVWPVSFMHGDLGFFGNETCPSNRPTARLPAKVLLMSPGPVPG